MLRANFSNFLNSFIAPMDGRKDDYVPKIEASIPEGTTRLKTNNFVEVPIDSDNIDNLGCLAPENMIKGKRQIVDGVKKEHAIPIKKHKSSRAGCDRDISNKMICPPRSLEDVIEICSDSDFEGTMIESSDEDRKAKKCVDTLKTMGIVKPEVINEAEGTSNEVQHVLRTRTSPKTLSDTIKALTVEQKAAVKDIGLGKLIGMKLDGIPIRLGFYVVDHFDSLKMSMNVNTGRIPVSTQSIHEILGLPMGGIDLMATDPDNRPNNIKTIWKKQYTKDRVRPMDIMHEIQRTKQHGIYFKLNFLVLVINVLAECSRMLYVESTSCATDTNDGPGLPLSKWTLDLLRRRQETEIENGGIGSSMIKGQVADAAKDIGRSSAGGPCGDTVKADISRELFLTKLDLKITELMDMVSGAESMLSDASVRFPYDEEVNNLNTKISAFLRNSIFVLNDSQMLNRDKKAFDKVGTPQTAPKHDNQLSVVDETTLNHDPLAIDVAATPLSPIWTSPTLFREVDRVSGQKSDADQNACAYVNKTLKQSISLPFTRGDTIMMGSLDGCIVDPGEASKMNDGSGMVDKFINKGTVVGCADFDPPGFDLGISPTQKGLKSVGKDFETDTVETNNMSRGEKRETKLGVKVRSPYMERTVSFVVSRDEKTLRDWVMRGVGGCVEKLFVTKCGKSLSRLELQTIADQAFVSSEVIDGWAMVLNDEEKLRSFDSPRRFFFPSAVSGDEGISDPGENTRETYKKFIRVIKRWCNNDTEMISMRNMDLVIFPVVSSCLVYMVVFNLRQPSVCIVDSEKQEGSVEDVYDFTPSALLHMMSIHLSNEGNHRWKAYTEMNIEQKSVRWQVVGNKIDRGVMLMRNMETFMGGDLRLWNSGLYKESTKQKKQLKDLRVKYVSKILMSEINIKKTTNNDNVQRFIAMEASIAFKKRQGGNRFPRYKA